MGLSWILTGYCVQDIDHHRIIDLQQSVECSFAIRAVECLQQCVDGILITGLSQKRVVAYGLVGCCHASGDHFVLGGGVLTG